MNQKIIIVMFHQFWSSIKQFIHSIWFIFVVFVASMFFKSIIFHYTIFNSIPISSLCTDFDYFFRFYLAKLLPCIVVGIFVVFTAKKYIWWSIVASFLIDIWIVANIFYYKANDLFIDYNAIKLINNLQGFESSLETLVSPVIIIFFLITLIYTCVVYVVKWENNIKIKHSIFISCSIVLIMVCAYVNYPLWKAWYSENKEEVVFDEDGYGGRYGWKFFLPFYEVHFLSTLNFKNVNWATGYVRRQSIISYFVAIFVGEWSKFDADYIDKLSEDEKSIISKCVNNSINKEDLSLNVSDTLTSDNLILIIFESLESWPLEDSVFANKYLPNLTKLCEDPHTLYCNRVTSQVLHGVSGDGQLIINTGLLPIQNGVACVNYSEQSYPNIAHNFDFSATISPSKNTWNQDKINERYGYKELVEPDDRTNHWNDAKVFDISFDKILEYQQKSTPFMLQIITIASHHPFNVEKINKKYETSNNIPKELAKYLSCVSYTDSCIGSFLNKIANTRDMHNNTIVITGDHTVFKSNLLESFRPYSIKRGLSIASGANYTPLIINSNKIHNNTFIDNVIYQMDIYPTIESLFNDSTYFWKGVGVNIMSSKIFNCREISEDEAYKISDLVIRSKFFDSNK